MSTTGGGSNGPPTRCIEIRSEEQVLASAVLQWSMRFRPSLSTRIHRDQARASRGRESRQDVQDLELHEQLCAPSTPIENSHSPRSTQWQQTWSRQPVPTR